LPISSKDLTISSTLWKRQISILPERWKISHMYMMSSASMPSIKCSPGLMITTSVSEERRYSTKTLRISLAVLSWPGIDPTMAE
jgi:hypothetical protein